MRTSVHCPVHKDRGGTGGGEAGDREPTVFSIHEVKRSRRFVLERVVDETAPLAPGEPPVVGAPRLNPFHRRCAGRWDHGRQVSGLVGIDKRHGDDSRTADRRRRQRPYAHSVRCVQDRAVGLPLSPADTRREHVQSRDPARCDCRRWRRRRGRRRQRYGVGVVTGGGVCEVTGPWDSWMCSTSMPTRIKPATAATVARSTAAVRVTEVLRESRERIGSCSDAFDQAMRHRAGVLVETVGCVAHDALSSVRMRARRSASFARASCNWCSTVRGEQPSALATSATLRSSP